MPCDLPDWIRIRQLHLNRLLLTILSVSLLYGCTSVQPIDKIGLIGPFEGLHRETGYAALDAVRSAIVACAPPNQSSMPLALDDSNQAEIARRSAEKLMQDPALSAIIGPYSYGTIAAVEDVFAAADLPAQGVSWVAPIAIDAGGRFADPADETKWLTHLTKEMVALAMREGADRVTVGGVPKVWTSAVHAVVDESNLGNRVQLLAIGDDNPPDNIEMANIVDQVGNGNALIWLGSVQAGAKIATELHRVHPQTSFWMGPSGDDPVFAQHYNGSGAVYWVTWLPPSYNGTIVRLAPGVALSLLSHEATCHAWTLSAGRPREDAQPLQLWVFRLNHDGSGSALANN